jgi:hypothetical protein
MDGVCMRAAARIAPSWLLVSGTPSLVSVSMHFDVSNILVCSEVRTRHLDA